MTERISCWPASRSEISCHFSIRHRVFVEEQGVMVFTDIDEWDQHRSTIHALSARGTRPAGVVRLYPTDDAGHWKGDRLAVLPSHRSSLVGVRLVQFAVATAAAADGIQMEAKVQVANTRFFERLGWLRDGAVRSYYGLPHQPMLIDLTKVPTFDSERPPDTELTLPAALVDASPLLAAS